MIKNVSSTFKANCKKDSIKYREYIVIDNKEVDIKFKELSTYEAAFISGTSPNILPIKKNDLILLFQLH